MPSKELIGLRKELDEVDGELLRWLATRMHISQRIGNYKRWNQLPVEQTEAAEQRMQFLIDYGEKLGLSEEFIRQYWSVVHAESCRVQTINKETTKTTY